MKTIRACLWTALLVAAPATHAVRAIDAPPPSPAAVLNTPQPDPAVQADDRSSLRHGTVMAVSPAADWVYVNGSWLGIDAGRTQLFQRGRPVQASQLSKGQALSFTLAPGAAGRKTLGVVYVP